MQRVRLEPLDGRWLDDVAELVADPRVRRFTRIPEPPPDGFARGWIASYGDGRREGTREGFAALDADGRFVGLGLAPAIDRRAGELELGYIVASDARGRGIATEILRLLTRWAFDALGAERAFLLIDVANRASARVAERCGYRLEGNMRSIYVKDGHRVDAGLWSRLPTEAEVPGPEQAWGGPLWRAADLITPMAVRVAATLRVADAITAGVTSGSELAARLGVAADPLVRVLDHLVTAGFLGHGGDGSYALTEAGQWLRDDHPQGIRAWIDLDGAIGHADTSAVELLHTVRTGEAAFPQRFGAGFWADLAEHPARAASFHALMGGGSAADAPVVAGAYDWSSLGEVVDVGGGDGSLLIALLRAHPSLRGTVLDLAAPTATAARALAAAGLADRGRAQTGSFFEPLPAGAGGYILSRVLHDWDDDRAREVLANCAQAAGPDGKVLVVQDGAGQGESPSTEMDLRMLAYCSGRERSLHQLTDLAHRAGLALGTVTPIPPRAIVEFLPETTLRAHG